jgi:hypothetical protein
MRVLANGLTVSAERCFRTGATRAARIETGGAARWFLS